MNIISIDLNLLTIFDALYAARSVSKAAKQSGLSQPAMSHALGRLRDVFGDELFVRTPRGIVPTARAETLAPRIEEAIAAIRRALEQPERFDPTHQIARISLASTDFFDHVLLPKLLPLLQKEAPGVVVVTRPLMGRLPKKDLEEGSLDLAIAGFFGDLPEGFYRQTVLEENYACLVRQEHPRIKGKLTLKDFANEGHLLVSPQGDLRGIVDHVMEQRGIQRKVVAGVSSFHLPPWIVAESDLIVTLPRRLAKIYERVLPLKMYDSPIPIPGFTIVQVWHGRTHHAPLHRWFRGLIRSCVSD